MKNLTEFSFLIFAVVLVIILTFMPHEFQDILINFLVNFFDFITSMFSSSPSLFDSRMLVSNLGHLIVFCILGYSVGRFGKKYSMAPQIIILLTFTIISEISQYFVRGREPSMSDLVINISAVLTGYLIAISKKDTRRRISKPK